MKQMIIMAIVIIMNLRNITIAIIASKCLRSPAIMKKSQIRK